jgi:hypothetical protein
MAAVKTFVAGESPWWARVSCFLARDWQWLLCECDRVSAACRFVERICCSSVCVARRNGDPEWMSSTVDTWGIVCEVNAVESMVRVISKLRCLGTSRGSGWLVLFPNNTTSGHRR